MIINKLNILDQVLSELRSLGNVTLEQIKNDWKVQRIIERELQILIEIVIDICQRIISISGQTPAVTGAQAINKCIKLGALSNNTDYQKMVQFRNFIVHHYENIDPKIFVTIVNSHLNDFSIFSKEIKLYLQTEHR